MPVSREMIYEEVGREMAAAGGGAPRADLGYAEAVPPQYIETEEEADIGNKTVHNMKMLKKSMMVGMKLTN